MKRSLYPQMAWSGIRKNKRLYVPYILTCIGMVMMFYIISFLGTSSVLESMPGGGFMRTMLGLGTGVIGVFAVIFLFYTNSFLIRRRKKEFGLYNILGMGKGNLARILVWETLMTAAIALGGGLLFGIAFSKFAELGMVNILRAEVTFSFALAPESVWQTVKLFAVIFLLLFANSLRQIQTARPMELLRSENTGEKPPKANWFLALMGALILAAAYRLAVSIEEPVSALLWFFVAVVMVIIATYLLFVAGSVAVCRLLQKKKRYYYKTSHFVSVSSMVYRMKRNGAGLASICILCTMVLVMLSSTVCLYIGTEDGLRSRYPRNITVETTFDDMDLFQSDAADRIKELSEQVIRDQGQTMEEILDYKSALFAGYIQDGRVVTDDSALYAFQIRSYADIWQVFVISVEDYNHLMGQNEILEEGEVMLYTTKSRYGWETVALGDGEPFQVRKVVSEFVNNGTDIQQVIPSLYIFVPDVAEFVAPLMDLADEKGNRLVDLKWFYGFDLACSDEQQAQILEELEEVLDQNQKQETQKGVRSRCESVAKERADFYGLTGGMFFLGILLGVVFLFAAVLIIYYKQISEGYEDQSRFEIMQKVGMTKAEIKKSIHSQVLTVFFLPLVTAGIHLGFAFPMLYKMLVLFALTNLRLLILVTAGCFLIFAVFYMIVYHITSKAYYHIVSGAKDAGDHF